MTDELKRGSIVRGRGLYIRLPLLERLRAARGVPQAVVKVSSFGHGVKGVGKSVDYISREGELELETESGDMIKGREEQKALVKNWSRDFDSRKDSRDSVHITFSMPRGSNPEALRKSVRTVLAKQFPSHEAVFAIHTDRPHPHAHVIMKMRGREKEEKLRLRKRDLFELRQVFAEAAHEQGIELAASPRAARGVGRKGIKREIYQLRKKGITPSVDKQAYEELLKELRSGRLEVKPWEKAMRERNQKERDAYREDGRSLRAAAAKEQDPRMQQSFLMAARQFEQFSRTMPRPQTLRQVVIEKILGPNPNLRQRSREKDTGHER